MAYPEESSIGREEWQPVCKICGKPSEQMICHACADKIRAEALNRKRHEEKAGTAL